MPHQTRAVLFDATGTLIALRKPAGETYARIAREFGVELPAARLQSSLEHTLGHSPAMVFPRVPDAQIESLERAWWRNVVRDTFSEAGAKLGPSTVDACFERLFDTFSDPDAWRASPGAIDTLKALRAGGLHTGVISNFDHRLRKILEGLGFGSLLDCIVIPADVRVAKPAPEIFACALEMLAVMPGEAIFVGDRHEPDLEGARRAGLHAIDVRTLATLMDLPGQILD